MVAQFSIRTLVQFRRDGMRGIAGLDAQGDARLLSGASTTRELALQAVAAGVRLAELAERRTGDALDLSGVSLLAAIDHSDPAHLTVSGTGLTHVGSAEGRDRMHQAAAAGQATNSMRMFLMGEAGGKPADGEAGAQPEWFYKGDGSTLVGPDEALQMPAFALDGGEEPEIAGIYLIGDDGAPLRLGFALGNEFSDHVTERENYLWLAHSKLRPAALGPELLLGELQPDVRGTSRIRRSGEVMWEKPFATGEANMTHSIANLEHHHFKYARFRRPGDVHVHFFGTATASFADGIATRLGDVFEIEAAPFHLPLRNSLLHGEDDGVVLVRSPVTRVALGIAGYGKIAHDQHEPAISASDDFELVAVADPESAHDSLASYSSLAAMLEARPEITAVSLCMPPRFRAPAAIEAITAGRHVLLEKPPCETFTEAEQLVRLARQQGVSLYTAWHSQHAAAVSAARDWLAGSTIRSIQVTWKEDVRVWHPGQVWIWQKGGFGVFDPGINALSILTSILPGGLQLIDAELEVPVDCVTPIAAHLELASEGIPISAEFDFRQTGPQSWDIAVETDGGALLLSQGGNTLFVDGERQDVGGEAEYRRLYHRFAALIRANRSEADLAPLRLVAEALEKGRVIPVEAFGEQA